MAAMNLFDFSESNLVPKDGELFYHPEFFEHSSDRQSYEALKKNIDWKQEGMKIFGKYVPFPRLTAWYGDAGKVYTYSGLANTPLPFSDFLNSIKHRVESKVDSPFNCALLNYYKDGLDSMGWHSDDEKELGCNPVIASVSFGGTRQFQLKHKLDKDCKLSLKLENGSLLVMKGSLQHFWQHCIPKNKTAQGRVNITFRFIP